MSLAGFSSELLDLARECAKVAEETDRPWVARECADALRDVEGRLLELACEAESLRHGEVVPEALGRPARTRPQRRVVWRARPGALKALLGRYGVSPAEAARGVDMALSNLLNIDMGGTTTQCVASATLKRIADYLGCPMDDLFDEIYEEA